MTCDSLQFVANKRWAKGFTINVGYTWVPRWTEEGAMRRPASARLRRRGLLLRTADPTSHRTHRITASGVWVAVCRNQRSLAGYLLGGWSIAPAFVYQSGQPWDMPGNVDLAPGVDLKQVAMSGDKEGQFIYGVKPCVSQRQSNGTYALLSVSTAYGCTEPCS
jgi:hypothetical protein